MDTKSLDMLEFPKVREIIAGYTSFPASHELANKILPSSNHAQVTLWLEQCGEARRLLATEPDFNIGVIEDVREFAGLAGRGKTMDTHELALIVGSLTSIRLMKMTLNRLSTDFPLLWAIAKDIADFRGLEKAINTCISPAGELSDSASPELQLIRRQIHQRRQDIIHRLESLIHSPRGQKVVQDPIVTEREGRYVIPIKTDSKHEFQGIIHDVSNTGATVFIEPFEAIEEGNELRQSETEEKREIERILKRLSDDVGARAGEIALAIALAAQIDLIVAKAKYARRTRANEVEVVSFEDGEAPALQLIEARHPLLGEKAVPLTIELGKEFNVMVITGPNTGGKTVALKTIGLLSLMALAGLPIPAKETSVIPMFDGIFVDIGDEQSIEQTLSTFSWHITNITRIIHSSTNRSLVALDELGTSTDPAEGSALACAILLHLLNKGAMAVATTHLGDLKAFAYATKGMQNASLDFDPANFTPTYHLTIGIPGGSNALETAARLGLDADIVEHARGMLSGGANEVEGLISDLNRERDAARALREGLEKSQADAERLKQKLETALRDLKIKERTVVQETRDRVVEEAAELQREIRETAAALRKEKSKEAVERTRKVVASVQERLHTPTWQLPTPPEDLAESEDTIAIGDTIRVKDANLEAKIVAIDERNNEIEVQAGQTRIKLARSAIEKIMAGRGSEPRRYVPIVKPAPKIVPLELLLLGKRAEEVEDLLDRYLDDASLANLTQVRIVHGSGTGVLREIVRKMLATHPLVKSFRPGEQGEGGNGVTVARL